ncbi:MAG: alpha-hydroxy-acid oxidizing enzyme [Rhizobiales bacterium PAR1]|nr:MAG: alpha-hydroxy-acid oxidizing enzyme [Rhizobiales bacterium PAR1]
MSTPVPVCLADYEALAQGVLGVPEAAYLFGGAADEITLRANRTAFDEMALVPRVLRDLRGGNTAVTLFGDRYSVPILVAPLAYQKLFHPAGEIATAQAAAAMETGFVLSTLASTSIEAAAGAGEGAPQWFQLYLQPERAQTLHLLRRAEAAGYRAIVVTVDAPINGLRNREMRTGFRLPDGIRAVNLGPTSGPMMPMHGDPIFDRLLASAPRTADIAWLRQNTKLPILIKGILHADDAEDALALGVDGVIVSNHGGRTLDTAIPGVLTLEAVARKVAGRVPVLLDGGIRRGTDIVKALALGASAVLVGRPVAAALAVGGAQSAAHALRLLAEECAAAMALCGLRTPDMITRAAVITATARPLP